MAEGLHHANGEYAAEFLGLSEPWFRLGHWLYIAIPGIKGRCKIRKQASVN